MGKRSGVSKKSSTPVEDYWREVYDIVEWAGRQYVVIQPPLPLVDDEAAA